MSRRFAVMDSCGLLSESAGTTHDLTGLDFVVSDYSEDQEMWGKGKGGMPDEPWPSGEIRYDVHEIELSGLKDSDEEFMAMLHSMSVGDKMKVDFRDEIDHHKNLQFKSDKAPVLGVEFSDDGDSVRIKTDLYAQVDVWE